LADAYSKESGVVIGQPEKEVVKERTKGPFEEALNSREILEALDSPTFVYTEQKGAAAMAEVFKNLYVDPGQLNQRLEELIKSYEEIVKTSLKNNPEKPFEAHRAFANKKVLKSLSSKEREAIEDFLNKNYQKMGGKGQRMISSDMPFQDFLDFLNK